MRYLTIQRNKSFLACLIKVKVYVEDMTSSEIKIHGVPCRKIGVLKNGEQQTFMIGDEKLRIFVIGDKISKNYCCDFYEVPAGTENIFLSGECRYNPMIGNAFRFDGIPTEEMKYHRKKALKKGIMVYVLSFLAGVAIFAGLLILTLFADPPEKVFTSSGISITLNDNFSEEYFSGYDAVYSTNYMAVFIKSEAFNGDEDFAALTVDEYCDAVIKANDKNTDVQHRDGLTYYSYDGVSDQGIKFRYLAFTFKDDDCFWLVQFAVEEDMYDLYEEDVFKYAKSFNCK